MRLGVVSYALVGLELGDALDRVEAMGLDAIELACAGWFTDLRHGDPALLAHDAAARARWQDEFARRGIEISALALHGQPLSPDPAVARAYVMQLRDACALAEQLGVTRLTLLAGLPEGAEGDRTPVWAMNAYPSDQQALLDWQWERRVIPYWNEQAKVAEAHGCRLCFEMHPMEVVYNPASLRRLRDALGPVVGCNFDPSHLWWQGIDPLDALRSLADCVYHVHAKDTAVNEHVVRRDGLFATTPFDRIAQRPWSFRTVGYGHDALFWRRFVSALHEIGYDDVLSIEHEDEYMDLLDGLAKGVRFLDPLVRSELQPPRRGAR
jgi:sugar phosphate isomerase/epimerase